MNIVNNDNEFIWNKINTPGSYEWWYFDCISDNSDYSMVIIIYSGFPFSPRYLKDINNKKNSCSYDFPGISVCLYKGNKRIINIHRTMQSIYNIDNGIIIKNPGQVTLEHKQDGSSRVFIETSTLYRNIKVKCDLHFSPIQNIFNSIPQQYSENKDHFWKPLSPKGYLEAEFEIIKNKQSEKINIKGMGYSDQNWGFVPIYHKISDWNWGRFHTEKLNGIYFDIEYEKDYDKRFSKLILYDSAGNLEYSGNTTFAYKKRKNYFNLSYGSEIKIKNNDISIITKCRDKVDNGPFYIRFISDFEINTGSEKISARGFTEYISPQRLKNKLLYPFISLKLK